MKGGFNPNKTVQLILCMDFKFVYFWSDISEASGNQVEPSMSWTSSERNRPFGYRTGPPACAQSHAKKQAGGGEQAGERAGRSGET